VIVKTPLLLLSDGGKYKSLSSATLSLEECDDLVNKFLAVSEK
jgi:hypothetical protein